MIFFFLITVKYLDNIDLKLLFWVQIFKKDLRLLLLLMKLLITTKFVERMRNIKIITKIYIYFFEE